MGMSTVTLHLRGVERETLVPALGNGAVLRDNNPPWLDVLTPDESAAPELEKLAKKLTKAEPEAAAVLFCYIDDDLFVCALYRGGKKAAGCRSGDSWAKLGKALDALFGDDLAGKAFRYAPRCTDLEEQVRLLEETLGTALLDHPEFEPRAVPRGDACLREIKAREAALRKRKDQCVLTELPAADWPMDWQAQLRLYQFMRPGWQDNHASDLLWGFGNSLYGIPQHPEYAVFVNYAFGPKDHFLRCKADSDRSEVIRTPARISQLVWQTLQGEPVCAYFEEMGEYGWIEGKTHTVIACLLPDGSPRWRFAPAAEGERLTHVHTSPEGLITLFAASRERHDVSFGAQLWQIDGETGNLLRKCTLPEDERMKTLVRAEALDGFVYIANRKELVALNDELEEISRWPGGEEIGRGEYLEEKNVVGPILWGQDFYSRALRRYDLRTGEETVTRPEVPADVFAVLPDGRFLGVNDKRNRLTVFDPAGMVISRHSLQGRVMQVRCEGDRILILENRAPDTYGFVSEELFEATSFYVWGLDPAE